MQIEELARLNQIIDELLFLSRAQAQAIALDLRPQSPERFLEMFDQDAAALTEHHGLRFAYAHPARASSTSRRSGSGRCCSTC